MVCGGWPPAGMDSRPSDTAMVMFLLNAAARRAELADLQLGDLA
jgi:hypothetical protein